MSSIIDNIKKGFFWQIIGLISSFLNVPLAINYLGKESYGIWILMYSFLLILSSCDLGIPSSFRNLLTESIAKEDKNAIRKVVSTAFSIMFVVATFIFIGMLAFIPNSDYEIFHYFPVIFIVTILLITLCDYNLKLILTIYTSHQKSFMVVFSTALINITFLIGVFTINYFNFGGSHKLILFCSLLPISSLIVNLFIMLRAFLGDFRYLKPKLSYISLKYIKPLVLSGSVFFMIQISMAILTQYSSILVYKYANGEVLAEVSIIEKYFGMISVVGSVILFPFWSKFTEAYTKGEYQWIKDCLKKLELLFIIICLAVILLWALFPYILKLWMFDSSIVVSSTLSAVIAIKYLAILWNSIYSYFLNGIGRVKVQMVFYVVGASLITPASVVLFERYNVIGIIGYSVLFYVMLSLVQKYQVRKILIGCI